MPDLKFDLDDDVSISDLRIVERWFGRLRRSGKLRLQRRGEVLGVLVSPREWGAIREEAEYYKRVLESIEDERDRRIIAERERARVLAGSKLRHVLEQELRETGLA